MNGKMKLKIKAAIARPEVWAVAEVGVAERVWTNTNGSAAAGVWLLGAAAVPHAEQNFPSNCAPQLLQNILFPL